jgi:hypothetical protein
MSQIFGCSIDKGDARVSIFCAQSREGSAILCIGILEDVMLRCLRWPAKPIVVHTGIVNPRSKGI